MPTTATLKTYRSKRVQAAWLGNSRDGVTGETYATTDSSCMQGAVFANFIKEFDNHIDAGDLKRGKPHILLLDGRASHMSLEVIQLARSLNIELFQLPSHSSHIIQPLDVLTTCAPRHGCRMLVKADMVEVIGEAWKRSFHRSADQGVI